MSVHFIGDPHLGHRNIAKFRPWVDDTDHNTRIFINQWRFHIRKRDVVFVMGDAAFDDESLDVIGNLVGRKILIKGNHDDFVSTQRQSQVFEEIHGMLRYKGMWLTHCPIHPDEMRGRKCNIHGHVHNKSIMIRKGIFRRLVEDPRYINTCVDKAYPRTGKIFTSLDDIRKICP